MKLHLGVIDLPYAYLEKKKARANKRRKKKGLPPLAGSPTPTTGQVARILEDKYHIMELFYEDNRNFVGKALEESLQGSLEDILMGAPVNPTPNPFAEAESEIQNRFKKFLSTREVESLGIPGVPTQAALDGRSSRFKKGKSPTGRRPSFIDTGLYQSSFKAWTE